MSKAGNRAPTSEETELALRHCWQPVARLEDLRDGPRRAVLLGEPLAVFLTEGGAARVVSNRCPHRGASLAMGAVRGEAIQCPYHGWEWDGDSGGCTRIPSLADQRQIPPGARVATFPARVQWGLVWTVLAEPLGEPPSPPWFDPDEWRWGHGDPFELPVGLGLMIENFRDVAHFAFVHKATLGEMPEVIEPLAMSREGTEATMHREMRGGAGGEEVWGSLREIYYHTVAPNFTSARMVTTDAERCLLHTARAISATESVHYWLVGLSRDFEEQTLEEAIEAEARVYAEDRRVVSAVEPPELPLDPNTDLNTLADRFTLAYREGFSEFVSRALSLR